MELEEGGGSRADPSPRGGAWGLASNGLGEGGGQPWELEAQGRMEGLQARETDSKRPFGLPMPGRQHAWLTPDPGIARGRLFLHTCLCISSPGSRLSSSPPPRAFAFVLPKASSLPLVSMIFAWKLPHPGPGEQGSAPSPLPGVGGGLVYP